METPAPRSRFPMQGKAPCFAPLSAAGRFNPFTPKLSCSELASPSPHRARQSLTLQLQSSEPITPPCYPIAPQPKPIAAGGRSLWRFRGGHAPLRGRPRH